MSASDWESPAQAWLAAWQSSAEVLKLWAAESTADVGCLGRLSLCLISLPSADQDESDMKVATLVNWRDPTRRIGQIVRVDTAGHVIYAVSGLRVEDRWRDLSACEVLVLS